MLAFASLPPAGPLHLPLSGSTAERIVAALLAKDEAARAEELQLGLARDPAFALWAVLVVNRRGSTEPTLSALGQWLAGHVLDELTWSAHAADLALEIPAARRKKHAALAAESIGIARLAAEIAELHSLDAGQAELLGLLCHAHQWISLSPAADRPQPDPCVALLPAWLTESLEEIARADGNAVTSPAGCVALAQQIIKSRVRGTALPRTLKFDRRRHLAATEAAAREWLKPAPAGAWLPELAHKLRQLRALQADFDRLLETEKLESLKELAQGAGHEINNPLANISARAQTLLNDERDPERRRMLASINTQAFRAHEMITDMMLFARPPQLVRKPTDVAALVNSLAGQFRAQAEVQQVELVCHASDATIMADIDAAQIHEALAAVVTNALEALVTGGRIELAVASNSPDQVQITVADNGPGIPPDVRRHLFDPFYSGREAGRGIGLGLSKCWQIVRSHGGEIAVECPPTGGARFTITLPTTAPPQMA